MLCRRRHKTTLCLVILLTIIQCCYIQALSTSATTPNNNNNSDNNKNNNSDNNGTPNNSSTTKVTTQKPTTTGASTQNNDTKPTSSPPLSPTTKSSTNMTGSKPTDSNGSGAAGAVTNKTTVAGSASSTQTQPSTTVSTNTGSSSGSGNSSSTANAPATAPNNQSSTSTPKSSVTTVNGSSTENPTGTGSSTTPNPSPTNNGTSKPTSEGPQVTGNSTDTTKPTTRGVTTTMVNSSTTTPTSVNPTTLVPQSSTNQTSQAPKSTNQTTTTSTSPAPTTTKQPTEGPSTTVKQTTPAPTTTQTPVVTTSNQTTAAPSNTTPTAIVTDKPATATVHTPVTEPPSAQFVYINEIIVNKQGIFQTIEIQTSSQLNLTHYAIVMVDGRTNKTLSVFYLRNGNRSNQGLLIVQLNSSSTLSNKGTGIAIYDTRYLTSRSSFNNDWNVNKVGLVDALVIGKTYEDISASLVNILTPGADPFVLDPSKYGNNRSISRCSNGALRSTEMYAFINPSMGNDNHDKCMEKAHFQNSLSIKIKMDCGLLKYPNNTVNEQLMREIIKLVVRDVNRKCQCGITRMHVIDPQIQCCTDTILDMKFVAPNQAQDDEFLQSFQAFIANTNNIDVNDQTYTLDQSCLNDCCNQVIQPLSKKDNSKDIRVTVAVIVCLLVLFLIIVLVVYMYMRKKKRAVQQFRMSRLEEDYEDFDDMTVGIANDDHDEFVGGQEATFDLKA